jgi:hypothetical protein
VLPIVFDKVVKKTEFDFPGLAHQGDATMSISTALETVTNWLERVAERDPLLFKQLMDRIRLPVSSTISDVKEPGNA